MGLAWSRSVFSGRDRAAGLHVPFGLEEELNKNARYFFLGFAALGAFLFFFRKPKQIEGTDTLTRREVEALARMLYAETSFIHDELESSAVVNVALNRAAHSGVSVETVVRPPGRPLWNGSPIYAERYEEANRTPKWDYGVNLVIRS